MYLHVAFIEPTFTRKQRYNESNYLTNLPWRSRFCDKNRFLLTSSLVGAATRTAKQRLRMAGITLVNDVLHRTKRHVEQYFSIVRRNACCASFVNRSTSISTTTAKQNISAIWISFAQNFHKSSHLQANNSKFFYNQTNFFQIFNEAKFVRQLVPSWYLLGLERCHYKMGLTHMSLIKSQKHFDLRVIKLWLVLSTAPKMVRKCKLDTGSTGMHRTIQIKNEIQLRCNVRLIFWQRYTSTVPEMACDSILTRTPDIWGSQG